MPKFHGRLTLTALVVTLALGLYPPPLIRQAAQSAAQVLRQSAATQHAGR